MRAVVKNNRDRRYGVVLYRTNTRPRYTQYVTPDVAGELSEAYTWSELPGV